eukprot:gene19745-6903_t
MHDEIGIKPTMKCDFYATETNWIHEDGWVVREYWDPVMLGSGTRGTKRSKSLEPDNRTD